MLTVEKLEILEWLEKKKNIPMIFPLQSSYH